MKLARLDSLPRMDDKFDGGEPDFHYENRQVIVVDDLYDFVANNATDLTDTDENAILSWHQYGPAHLGQFTEFTDWMVLRDIVKVLVTNIAGLDYSGYAVMAANVRAAASHYIPTKVSFPQLITDCGGDVNEAILRVDDYLLKSTEAREVRYAHLVNYVYQCLGTSDALKAEDDVINERLVYKYVERGVGRESIDSVKGLFDWIDATGSYPNGLKQMIIDNVVTIKNGTDLNTFIDSCLAIVRDGNY